MARYIDYNYNQSTFISINFQDQFQPSTLEYAPNYLVYNELDLAYFDAVYKYETNGRPAYDHVILLKIILFANSKCTASIQ